MFCAFAIVFSRCCNFPRVNLNQLRQHQVKWLLVFFLTQESSNCSMRFILYLSSYITFCNFRLVSNLHHTPGWKAGHAKKSSQETLKINTPNWPIVKKDHTENSLFNRVISRRGEWVYGIDNSRVPKNTHHCGQVF